MIWALFRYHFGIISVSFEYQFGIILVRFWYKFGITWIPVSYNFWCHFGTMLVWSGYYFGIILVSFPYDFNVILVSVRYHLDGIWSEYRPRIGREPDPEQPRPRKPAPRESPWKHVALASTWVLAMIFSEKPRETLTKRTSENWRSLERVFDSHTQRRNSFAFT